MPSMGGSATLVSAPRYGDLTNVDTTGQADHQVFAWDATAAKYKPLTGVVGDGAGGLKIAGDVRIAGNLGIATLDSQTLFPLLIGDGTGAAAVTADTLSGAHVLTVGDNSAPTQLAIDTSGHAAGAPNFVLVSDLGQEIRGYDNGTLIAHLGLSLFDHAAPTVQATGGAATAGGTYTAAEAAMLQAVYDAARAIGLLT